MLPIRFFHADWFFDADMLLLRADITLAASLSLFRYIYAIHARQLTRCRADADDAFIIMLCLSQAHATPCHAVDDDVIFAIILLLPRRCRLFFR